MKIKLTILALLSAMIGFGQNLKTFTTSMRPDSNRYLSIKNMKAYSESDAGDVQPALDLTLVLTTYDNNKTLEWYNLKKGNDKVPATLTGTATGITAISFDKEQFEKCKTTADLDRMTGHISVNSFSHFAVVSNGDQIIYPCFLARMENGKKALLYILALPKNIFLVTVKWQP